MNLIKVITENFEPTDSDNDSSGIQRSIRIKMKKLRIHFEDEVNVFCLLQHNSMASNTILNEGDIDKIVQRALMVVNRGDPPHLGGPASPRKV